MINNNTTIPKMDNGFCKRLASLGFFQTSNAPRQSGKASINNVWVKNFIELKSLPTSISRVGAYMDNQNKIETGVINAAAKDDVAVIETDNAILARPNIASKLEILPPGQQDTIIMPKAKDGAGFSNITKPSVSNGKPIICANTPAR